jgi:hypothetical protein
MLEAMKALVKQKDIRALAASVVNPR